MDLTLEDLCARYTETYPVPVSPSTRPATLKRLKITRKRKSHSDPKKVTEPGQSDTERDHRQVDDIPLDQRLYLDETASRLNLTLPCGRAPEGERVIDEKPVSRGESVRTVAVLFHPSAVAAHRARTLQNLVSRRARVDDTTPARLP